jgi:hypothetical protein
MQSFCHTAAYPKLVDVNMHRELPSFISTRGGRHHPARPGQRHSAVRHQVGDLPMLKLRCDDAGWLVDWLMYCWKGGRNLRRAGGAKISLLMAARRQPRLQTRH